MAVLEKSTCVRDKIKQVHFSNLDLQFQLQALDNMVLLLP